MALLFYDESVTGLRLTRDQILSHRREVSALDRRLSHSQRSLERAAFAGLQDSMPRAALLSVHARVEAVGPSAWGERPFVQVWGPRYSAFVVAETDIAVFTLGRMPDSPKARKRAEDIASRVEAVLGGERMDCRELGAAVGLHPTSLRYAAPTGRFLIHWDGAKQPIIWSVPAPDADPGEARLELARRHLHIFGPTTPNAFASWAGVKPRTAASVFDSLTPELTAVDTPVGPGWILEADETAFRGARSRGQTRLLPSGDTYYLLQGRDRDLLVPDEARRRQLWTPRVWPGAVLHEGEIVGTWRRAGHRVTVDPWVPLDDVVRNAVEAEAMTLPLPGGEPVRVTWS